ncbi:regulator of G- signaling 22 [Pelobates cultripes]|uniref:Regulator of G- signaling 22 n=1 Tax=Pelobates cultripes TaxID=61616 RepID=A0AAD1S324_PELCU|nr:regulator of G- signaling 22 [Pelobates cultripes]
MRLKRLAAEPPGVTEDNFEDFLAIDDLLVEYFNEFLSLPTFADAIKFNKTFGIFEVTNKEPERLRQQMKELLRKHQPPDNIYAATRSVTGFKAKKSSITNISIDNTYSVMCLNREQGVQWIKRERVPAFLKSDCYFEYRLAKLMSQVQVKNVGEKLYVDPKYEPWVRRKVRSDSQPEETEDEEIMRKFYVSLGQASFTQTKEWFTMARQSELTAVRNSFNRPVAWGSANSSETFLSTQNGSQDTDGNYEEIISNKHNSSLHQKLPVTPDRFGSDSRDDEEYSVSIAPSPSVTPVRLSIEPKWNKGYDCKKESKDKSKLLKDGQSQKEPVFQTLDEFVLFYTDRITKSAVSELNREPGVGTTQDIDIHTLSRDSPSTEPASISSRNSEISVEEEDAESEIDERGVLAISTHNKGHVHINSRREFERFKAFLKGTSGERLLWLWMDIERLKAIKDIKRQQSHLNKMKRLYLETTGEHYVNAEVLQKLEILDTNRWKVTHLQNVQTEVVKPLLLYWGPRFCLADSSFAQNVDADLKLWYDRQLRPKRDADPFAQTVTLLPLRPKTCVPKITTSAPPPIESGPPVLSTRVYTKDSSARQRLISANLTPQRKYSRSLPGSAVYSSESAKRRGRPGSTTLSSGASDVAKETPGALYDEHVLKDILSKEYTVSSIVLRSSEMEDMLQALYLENRAGYFFTTFCERSGNKIWENSVYFWFDLQSYRHLFYQEALEPFRLRRQSQLIFGTYLAPSASMDIGAEQNIKKEIYQKLDPPFEDLFDAAEEYILTLLLSAWLQMTELNRQAYRKSQVALVEETRQLDSVYYRKLRALLEEKASRKDEVQAPKSIFLPPPDIPREPNLWDQVPEEYRNYNLGTLIRHRMELEHFRKFLDENFASMDLMCWIDLEQFRRMPHKEKEKRHEKSVDIKNKYLNKKYFFGPNSPATRDQQEQVMQLAGGWGKLLHDKLSPSVLVEIQKYVRMRIERKWLPMFLSTEEYRERQKVHAQMKDVAEDVVFQTNKKKIGVWKHLDSKWISSSKEIIAFRKALMNPVTASQFQRFISLKGDFFENGLLFWQEVQRYKELCHSHCDESIIQNKITAIINCFINSSIPPALQIDIPPEQAEKILERRRDLGPYVFREAQMTIFSIMFKYWPEFCEFRSNLADEKILPFLERKKNKKMEQLKRKLKAEEMLAKKQQEDSKRKHSISELYGDNESSYSEDVISGQEGYGRSRNVSWTYSKYLEGLEQELMLLKMQQDLEKKTGSFSSSDNASTYSLKSEASRRTGKSGYTERVTSAVARRFI